MTANEGILLSTNPSAIDFVGSGVNATQSGGTTTVTINQTPVTLADKNIAFGTASGTGVVGTSSLTYDKSTNTLTLDNIVVNQSASLPGGSETFTGTHSASISEGAFVFTVPGTNSAGMLFQSGIVTGTNTPIDMNRVDWLFDAGIGTTAAIVNGSITVPTGKTVSYSVTIPGGLLGPWDEVVLVSSCSFGTTTGNGQFMHCQYIDNAQIVSGATITSAASNASWFGIGRILLCGTTTTQIILAQISITRQYLEWQVSRIATCGKQYLLSVQTGAVHTH
jgi:hypothetical protein